MKDFDYSKLIIPGTILGVSIGLIVLISQVKGFFVKSEEDKIFEKEEKAVDFVFTQSFFNYLKKKVAGRKVRKPDAKKMLDFSQRIKQAIGNFKDDESAIHSVFQQLENQLDAFTVSLLYENNYKRSLLSDIQNNLGQNDLSKIYSALRKLPLFILENGTAVTK